MINGNDGQYEFKGSEELGEHARTKRAGLISYLAQLGLGDEDLTKVFSMLPESKQEDFDQAQRRHDLLEAMQGEDLLEMAPSLEYHSDTVLPIARSKGGPKRTVTLYLAEEQQILREAYLSFLREHPSIDLMGASDDVSIDSLIDAARNLKPNVMLLGMKTVHAETSILLDALREEAPDVGLVLLFAFYDSHGIKALRRLSKGGGAGCAYLLKHTIDTANQLTQVIYAVSEGRIIVDPMVMDGLVNSGGANSSVLSELSPRELEVLSWMAKGFRNDTIAQVLTRDVRTVERHINSIYGKLDIDDASKDPRVNAALKYLQATGSLPLETRSED